ncbi:rhomboid family intramembrane serine protease [Streptomyces sp. SID13031]|uniref:rhomboid family intramembrane serine protease n=1 Tax=Streptomyces sp. SID13031 TaxID=2706046 RepID=UPI0013CA7510|nr:rhomboid family intramembrane serine protease [Streptomyces sp. SID13031]NEA32553.1 rhomboid family intramembrane serine protease [Streptomyces sp. SID13031]
MSYPTPARRTRSVVDGAKITSGLILLGVLVGLMWLSEIVDTALNGKLDQYGILARDPDGLFGILTSPFLHGGFGHLISNTLPLLALGALIAFSGALRLFSVTAIVATIGGLGTWLTSPPHSNTIGASGLVFGFAGYLITRGVFNRRLGQVAIGVLVVLIWGGGLLSGLLPQDGISWQGHLFGGIAGIFAAWVLSDDRPKAIAATPRPVI